MKHTTIVGFTILLSVSLCIFPLDGHRNPLISVCPGEGKFWLNYIKISCINGNFKCNILRKNLKVPDMAITNVSMIELTECAHS